MRVIVASVVLLTVTLLLDGDIMVHGLPKKYAWLGKSHTLHDWTDGCIAVTDEEVDEIWKMVRLGTPIDIRP